MNIPFEYWQENIKWHSCHVTKHPDGLTISEYETIVLWLVNTIDGVFKHVRWQVQDNGIGVKFRYERDYILFTLRWA